MAHTDWDLMSGSAELEVIARGHTSAVGIFGTQPHAIAFHSLEPVIAVSAYTCKVAGFDPAVNRVGVSINAYMRRVPPHAGCSPMIFATNSRNVNSGEAYKLGFSNDTPGNVMLARGPLSTGLELDAALAVESSAALFTTDWVKLGLSLVIELQGDIVIHAYGNDALILDTAANPIVDDAAGLLTGSTPIQGDMYVGFGHHNAGEQGMVTAFTLMSVTRVLTETHI